MCFALLAALCGCGLKPLIQGELKPPRVSLEAFSMHPPTARGLPLTAVLQLENPNSQAINLLGYDYEVWLEGRSVAQGESQQPINLPPRGRERVEAPILVKLAAVVKILPGAVRQGTLHYRISGGFRPAALAGFIRVPFQFQGRVALKEGLERLTKTESHFPTDVRLSPSSRSIP